MLRTPQHFTACAIVQAAENIGRGAEEYRQFAVSCLEIAANMDRAQTKAAMLQMAGVWSRLADLC